jgi:membrane-associated protease RseP (regulator of RpoE activity)
MSDGRASRRTAAVAVAALLVVSLLAVLVARAWGPSPPVATAPAPSPTVAAPEPPEDRTPEIRGRIVDAEDSAAPGATVRLVSPRPPYSVFRETKADAAGRFSFANVRAGDVRVVADQDPGGVVSSAELHVREGQTMEITLVLSAASAVKGTVTDTDDHPVAGVVVSVEGAPWIVRSATSDAAGAFRLAAVPQEAASLVAVARGYKMARVALPTRGAQEEIAVRVRLATAPPVDGDVKDESGNPVRARVVACEGRPLEARVTSADDGTFQLPPSAIGCDAVAHHDEAAPSEPMPVVEGRRISLRLKPGGSIEGVVTDEGGAVVTAFEVGIESSATSRGRGPRRGGKRSFEDPRGAFRMEKLPPGSYVLTATAPGKALARSDAIEVASGVATTGVRIALSRGGVVTGRVTDDKRAPIAGVDLQFDSVSSVFDSTAAAKTDAAGFYRLEGAPSGPFTLRVAKDGFRVRLVSGLRVDARGALTQDVTLTVADGGAGTELGGIGAILRPTREGVTFVSVNPGDPAERAGLRAGDRILRIDGEDAEGMSLADALQRLRGQAGTSVGVSVLRAGETIDVMVVRAAIVR